LRRGRAALWQRDRHENRPKGVRHDLDPGQGFGGRRLDAGVRAKDVRLAQNGQDRKLAFVNALADSRTTSPDRVAAPASSYVVQAGNIIPAALTTGIHTDLSLPGL
jgi:type IV secretory pathway VirB10-like protein